MAKLLSDALILESSLAAQPQEMLDNPDGQKLP
jgi:hypothetical protein